MISADLIPEELQRIEYQIRMKQELIKQNRDVINMLQTKTDGLRADLAVLEDKKYRLFTGRNI